MPRRESKYLSFTHPCAVLPRASAQICWIQYPYDMFCDTGAPFFDSPPLIALDSQDATFLV